MERISGAGSLACPLCGGGVGASGCLTCHLSVAEIARHQGTHRRHWSKSWGRVFWTRLIGLIVYSGIAVWSWYFMPTAFLFVLPGALVGAYFQTLRGRPVVGALLCFTIVVVVPSLLWSAGLTGVFADLTGGN